MGQILDITVSDLVVDSENPRLLEPNQGQRAALRALAHNQQAKLVALAKDIIKHGLNPSELPIVMQMEGDQYVSLEGNRRLTALRALDNPDLLRDVVSGPVLSQFRKLSKEYQESPIESVTCWVVYSRDEARHWIELRHTGENKGAGIVKWGSDEGSRFQSRTGRPEIHIQALNFLQEQHELDRDRRKKVPVTSLKRLLSTPVVRTKLGLDIESGTLMLMASTAKVAKALKYVVDDLVEKRINTKAIYTRDLREKYANELPKRIAVKATKKPGEGVPATEAEKAAVKSSKAKPKRKSPRDRLIPKDCTLYVTDERICQMESELRQLSLAKHTNAVCVLLRVFLELSMDDYIDRKNLTGANFKSPLHRKFEVVLDDLLQKNKLTVQQAVPVRKARQKDSFLAPSITLMHQYIHNKHIFPVAGDMRAHWDSLQPFVMAIWAP